MKVLVLGADGFIGKNLCQCLAELPGYDVLRFGRSDSADALATLVADADVIVHLAGVNRPTDDSAFEAGNVGFTRQLAEIVRSSGRPAQVIFSSSIQAGNGTPYGASKLQAEKCLQSLADDTNSQVAIFRLANVFGKWSRPNYNSAVATFCHNIARDLPIQINDPAAILRLVYVDDVVAAFIDQISDKTSNEPGAHFVEVAPVYEISVGNMAERIRNYRQSRETSVIAGVGVGLDRALYATYVSFLPMDDFSYPLVQHADSRGRFVEMLKTRDSGQFSFFTAGPGITRGGHYHHTKTEKFLVIQGTALFRFRHMDTGVTHELTTLGLEPRIVETVPGWTHDITNVGDEEMIVMLWANEIFDRSRPDTFAATL